MGIDGQPVRATTTTSRDEIVVRKASLTKARVSDVYKLEWQI